MILRALRSRQIGRSDVLPRFEFESVGLCPILIGFKTKLGPNSLKVLELDIRTELNMQQSARM